MRNSEAQRYARWSAVLAILVAMAVTGEYLRREWLTKQEEKKAPPAVPAAIEQRSNEFSYSKVEGQRTIYTVRASHTTEFKEGKRNLLEDVAITVFGKTGERNDTLRTRACDFISDTGKITCAGEVQISLQSKADPSAGDNAVQVVTSGLSFDQHSGQAQTDRPVTFHWPSGEGRAVGLRYDSNGGTLYMERSVEMNLAASSPGIRPKTDAAAGSALHLTSNTLSYQRELRTVHIQGDVHARQTTHELSADSLLLQLDTAFHVQHLTAMGHPRILDSSVQGPMALAADEISAGMRPDGSVASIAAVGNVRGSRSSTAGEDRLQASRVQMALEGRQDVPRLVTAGGGVTLNSSAATAAGGTRRIESESLEMRFANPAKGSAQPGPALLESVNTLAPARVDWENTSLTAGKPVKQTMRMNGNRMNLRFDGQNQLQQLASSGGVEVTRQVGNDPEQSTSSRDLTAKFGNAGEWATVDQVGEVHFRDGLRGGQAERAHLDRASNVTTLTGGVILTDTNVRTTAQSATFIQGSTQLRADGSVLTTELHAGAGISNFAQEPAHVSADHLVADTGRGHAVYSGNGRLWQGSSVIEADTIELDNPTQILIARGNARGVFPQAAGGAGPGQITGKTATRTSTRVPLGNSPGAASGNLTNGSKTMPRPSGHPQTGLGRVQGGILTYWSNQSRARIEQGAKADFAQGSIQADLIDLYFSTSSGVNDTRQLSRSVAVGNVTVRQEDRRGTSNRAEYTASEGKFVLSEGKPTIYDSDGDTTTGRQLTFHFADDSIVVDSEAGSRTVTLHRVEK